MADVRRPQYCAGVFVLSHLESDDFMQFSLCKISSALTLINRKTDRQLHIKKNRLTYWELMFTNISQNTKEKDCKKITVDVLFIRLSILLENLVII